MIGTGEEWKKYREEFNSLVADAARQDSIPERGSLNHFFQQLDKAGTPVADPNGALWMEVPGGGESSRVGLSLSNVLSTELGPGAGASIGAGTHWARLEEPQAQSREHGGIQERLEPAAVGAFLQRIRVQWLPFQQGYMPAAN